MNAYATRAIGFICLTVIALFMITNCGGQTKLSDEAVKAQAQTCQAVGMVQKLHMVSGKIELTCEHVKSEVTEAK